MFSMPLAPGALASFLRSSSLSTWKPRPRNFDGPRCVTWMYGDGSVPRIYRRSLVRSVRAMPKRDKNSSASSRLGDCSRPNARSVTLMTGIAPPLAGSDAPIITAHAGGGRFRSAQGDAAQLLGGCAHLWGRGAPPGAPREKGGE